jgi:N-acyl-D-aspartate/D-glutamate deacylase
VYDLVIRNGQIVDGTGRKAFSGSIAIQDGVIAAVGDIEEGADRVIDAGGCLVTPGWVDTHSHMDGQATWDPYCSPASVHGITTLVMGNCGVGFAPCKPDAGERQRMIEVMEDVEDIPGAALSEGIDWQWESFPEYLDFLEGMPRAIDIGAQVPHCAVRTYVMGERGVNNEAASEEDVARMAAIVREGLQAGAVGFTTSRTQLHMTRNGEVMPGTYADASELLGIGRVLGETGRGIYGLVSDFADWRQEMDWMKQLSIENQCQVNFVLFYRSEADWPRVLQQLQYVKDAQAEGARLIPHVGARPVNILMSWEGTVNPFMFHQSFAPLAELDPATRLSKLRDPAVRRAIVEEVPPHLDHEIMDRIANGFDNLYVLDDLPDYEPGEQDSIAQRARQAGVSPAEFAYDALLENDGKRMLYCPLFGYDRRNLDRQIEMLTDESSVISLADTGAHCGVLSDASIPTWLLTYLVRDRRRGPRLELETAVRMHTRDTARCMGLNDRGTLEPGMKADINVIDLETLGVDSPQVVYDLPAGGRRVFQGATGYRFTLVSGQVVMENGVPTGALPGRLVRAGAQAGLH